jgi:electron transport complex protein RnfD
MVILQRLRVIAIRTIRAIVAFFTKVRPNKRKKFRKLDYAEICLSLVPITIFGCLVFGLKAVFTLAVCVAVCTFLAFIWDVIFERNNLKLDYKAILLGLCLGLTLTSGLEWYYILSVSALAIIIAKLFFRKNPLSMFYPAVIARVIFSIACYKQFTLYPIPLQGGESVVTPLNHMFDTFPFAFSAKELFFGVHTGAIGQVSECLIIIGAVYLMLRRLINPLICGVFIGASALLSYVSNQSLPLSLLGGGLFFAAFFLTMDYGFKDTSIWDKILYGLSCALITYIMRLILGAEGVVIAVLLSNLILQYANKRNFKRAGNFIKKPNFKKLFGMLWQHIA